MVDYPYAGILVADAVTFRRATNAAVTVYDLNDTAGATPLVLKDLSGLPLPNPLTSTSDGFVQPFVTTSEGVKLTGGGLTVVEYSHMGIKDAAVAAAAAAEASASAASEASAEAAAGAASALAGAVTNAQNAAAAAAASAALVGAPADTAIAAAINGSGTATKAALSATYATKGELASIDVSGQVAGKLDKTEAATTYVRGVVSATAPTSPTLGMVWFQITPPVDPVPGYVAKFTASTLALAHGATVSSWPAVDGSHSFATTGTPTLQSSGAFPYVQTNGTTDYLTAATVTAAQPDTIVVVARFPTIELSKFLFAGASSAGNQSYGTTSVANESFMWAGGQVKSTGLTTGWHIYIGTYNGASSEMQVDGVVKNAGNTGANPLSAGLRLAASETGASKTAAHYAEVRVYNRLLTSTEKTDLVAALKTKYGIA